MQLLLLKMDPSQLRNSNSDAGTSLMQLDSSSESSIMSEVPGSDLSAVTASSPVSSVSGAAVVPDSVNVSTSTATVPSVTCLDSSPLQTDVRRFSGSLSQSGHESSSTSFIDEDGHGKTNSSGSSCPDCDSEPLNLRTSV